jgi:hypothetical protein
VDRRVDVAVACAVALLGVLILVSAESIRPASIPDPIGSRGFPRAMGTALFLGGVALVLRRLLRWRRESTRVADEGVPDDPGVPPGSAPRALSIWAGAFAYVLLLPAVGYLIATPIFIAGVLALFGMRRPLALAGIAIGFTLPIFLVFAELLNVRLPTGILDAPLRQLGLV